MNFALTEEQSFIRDSARKFLSECATLQALRTALTSPAGWQADLWPLMAELGWLGAMVPEELGGSGLGAVELALILEEIGRTNAAVPFFETAVLGVQALLCAGSAAQQRAWLPELCAGHMRIACALTGAEGVPPTEGISVQLVQQGAGYVLYGEAEYVTFGHIADRLLVAARRLGSSGDDEVSLLFLPATRPGVEIERRTTLDLTRPYSRVRFTRVPITSDDMLGERGSAGPILSRVLILAAGLLAAEQTGGAAFCLSSTVEYARQRIQFGRPIGSFQAVKHQLADMAMRVEAARSAAYYAAAAIAENSEEVAEAAAIARVYCSEAFFRCAADAIQLHGGVGFTWEHHAHLYFKRARAAMNWLGDPALHRERLARIIGLGVPS